MPIKIGDTVLAYHGVMIYDAKVLKIDHGNGVHEDNDKIKPTASTQYFVHYLGWHKKWDEWVAFSRTLEVTPANRKLQAEAKENAAKEAANKKSAAKKKKISTGGIDPGSTRKSPFKKMKLNPENDTEELPMGEGDFDAARQVALQMPFSLKKQLVEDWKHITHEPRKLVPLPRKPSVAQIIANYLELKKAKLKPDNAADEKEFKNIEGIMEGVQSYFDRALGSILLYRHERRQYRDIQEKNPGAPLSEIYGAEHLVRLFVRLPVLLGSATIPERELAQIQPRLNDFLKYMQKQASSLFATEYQAMAMTTGTATATATEDASLAMLPWSMGRHSWRLWLVSLGLLYVAYQKHLLPNPVARVVGRVYFYPTWPFTYLSRRNDYWTLVDSHVFVGAAPMSFMHHVDALYARGVRAVVNLCDEYGGPVAQYKKRHIVQLYLPTIDHTEPSVADLEAAVAFIEEKKASGVRVYVHCKGGNGRSAAVAFAWLLYAHNMTLEEAQQYLNEKRRVRKTLYRQRNLVAYYEKLQSTRAASSATTS
ncbi:hypothetical protein P43SY_000673 [Pythium insidiosum]|uniref:Chromatin modification-related protein EAF3 n=1 Tax=Pythium insidiosum TaxID=114742 RepID=A0AAD5L9E4_PYTIN|nr:hypothetical protein P43SY_000673 [Pythium insidiosum]